jgi:hypothetical protein
MTSARGDHSTSPDGPGLDWRRQPRIAAPDAIRAINWSRNVRFQQEISEAVTNLRDWAALSATSIAEDC